MHQHNVSRSSEVIRRCRSKILPQIFGSTFEPEGHFRNYTEEKKVVIGIIDHIISCEQGQRGRRRAWTTLLARILPRRGDSAALLLRESTDLLSSPCIHSSVLAVISVAGRQVRLLALLRRRLALIRRHGHGLPTTTRPRLLGRQVRGG